MKMIQNSIYSKYKEERGYAKFLQEIKKSPFFIKKEVRVRLERVDLNELMKRKPSVPVSLPIKHYNNMRSNIKNNQDGQNELQKPKDNIGRTSSHSNNDVCNADRRIAPATKLRMVRHPVVAAPYDSIVIKSIPIKRNLLPVNLIIPATRDAERNSNEVEAYTPSNITDTAAKTNRMPIRGGDNITTKYVLPVPALPIKANNGIAHREVSFMNSKEIGTKTPNNIIDTAAKSNEMPFLGNDHISIKHKLPIKRNYGVAHKEVSFENSKDVGTNSSTNIIDTAAQANVMTFQDDDHISIKHKLPVPEMPTKKNYEIARREVSFTKAKEIGTKTPNNIIDTATKSNEMPFLGNDHISIKHKLPIKKNYGVAHKEVSFENSKDVGTNSSTNIIDTAAQANVMTFQDDDHISIKHKLPVPEMPTKKNYGMARREVSFTNYKEIGTSSQNNIIDTAAKSTEMPFLGNDHISIKRILPIKENYGIAEREASFPNSKDIGTNNSTDIIDTAAQANVMKFQEDDHISIKHKQPVPVAATNENYGIAGREVSFTNSKEIGTSTPNNIIDTAAKSNEMPFLGDDHISIKHKLLTQEHVPTKEGMAQSSVNEVERCARVVSSIETDNMPVINDKELKILDIVSKSGIATEDLGDALDNFKEIKELSTLKVNTVLDLEKPADTNGPNLLPLAKFHSAKNKKAIYENCVRLSEIMKFAPTPKNSEDEMILQMRYKLIQYMNCEQLQNMINSMPTTQNNENTNKKRKTTESDVNYDDTNMEMEVDIPETRTIVNQPVTATPLVNVQKSTIQQRQVQPINAQQQSQETNIPQIYSSPLQQTKQQEQLQQEYLQHQKMQQLQYLQELKHKNMRAKTKQPQQEQIFQFKNPQIQQPQMHQTQLQQPQLQQPQLQQPQLQQPQLQQPQLQPPHFQQSQLQQLQLQQTQLQQLQLQQHQLQQPQLQQHQLQQPQQHPLDRRIRIRNQQRGFLPQQHQYESTSNGYQNLIFSQVPQPTTSSHFPYFHGDPRIQTFQSQMTQMMPGAPQLMSTYEANLQASNSSYPFQNNSFNNHHYW